MSGRLIVGDAVKELARWPKRSVHLTVFSPPYDSVRDYKGNWVFDPVAFGKAIYRVTLDGGVCCCVIGDGTKDFAKSLSSFRLAVDWVDQCRWRLFEACVYQRHGRPGGWWSKRFRVDHEHILIFFKGERPRVFDKSSLMVPTKHAGVQYRGTIRRTDGTMASMASTVASTKCRGTVWEYATSNTEGNKTKMMHPATFPDRLAADLIACFSRPGDLVLDPCVGSGTTAVMAAKAGRDYVGIDVSDEYVQIARRRLAAET